MVLEPRRLVEGGLAWQFDLDDLALLEKGVDVAVDSRERHGGDVFPPEFEEFLGAERPATVLNRVADGGALAGVAGLWRVLSHA